MIAGQVLTQPAAGDGPAAGEPASAGLAQRGFGLLVPPRSQASGPGDLPDDYRSLLEAVTAVAAETGGAVTCMQAAARAGLDVSGRQSENVRAKLKRLEDRAAPRPGSSPSHPDPSLVRLPAGCPRRAHRRV